ncbi:hypothetical protein MMC07_005740 [Pseudocyphellaria aurata]|nr:hypothetical protein [Pseudocyphellaria aurata]
MLNIAITISSLVLCCSVVHVNSKSILPTVDLGYEIHQASSLDASALQTYISAGGYYNFSNIRYAEPPVGELRFRAPVPPRARNKTVNQGEIGRICPQADPAWLLIAAQFLPAYLAGKPFNGSAAEAALAASSIKPPPQDPRTSEDCLFLDVIVPQKVFSQARNAVKPAAPVLVWIYGGGYVNGEKTGNGLYTPAGLFNASRAAVSKEFIFVALNYRLGAFGWLAGPDLQADGTANAGLYDQRLALTWVQRHIHLFGGDPHQVTVMGESAGGGSILHQITAFGGLRGPAPFQQAILQSPGFEGSPSSFQQQQTFEKFLSLLKVKTIAEARKLPSSALILANTIQVGLSVYGSFSFNPVVDGLFAPALPGRLLLQGSFDNTINVMNGHNADEGLDFTDPAVQSDSSFGPYIRSRLPDIEPSVVDYIEKVLYPPIFDGSHGYTDQIGRSALLISDAFFQCHTDYLNRAFTNKTHAYQFSVPPALHGQDVNYTFFDGSSSSVVVPVAAALQGYITSFVTTGTPGGVNLPNFPLWGKEKNLVNLNVTEISVIKDPTANARCLWWQKALYY